MCQQFFHAVRTYGASLYQALQVSFASDATLASFVAWCRRCACTPHMLLLQVGQAAGSALPRCWGSLRRCVQLRLCGCATVSAPAAATACLCLLPTASQRCLPRAHWCVQQAGTADEDEGGPPTWANVMQATGQLLPSLTHLVIKWDGRASTGAQRASGYQTAQAVHLPPALRSERLALGAPAPSCAPLRAGRAAGPWLRQGSCLQELGLYCLELEITDSLSCLTKASRAMAARRSSGWAGPQGQRLHRAPSRAAACVPGAAAPACAPTCAPPGPWLQLRDLSVESSDAPLRVAPSLSLPPSLTKLFAVESRLDEVPGTPPWRPAACCLLPLAGAVAAVVPRPAAPQRVKRTLLLPLAPPTPRPAARAAEALRQAPLEALYLSRNPLAADSLTRLAPLSSCL